MRCRRRTAVVVVGLLAFSAWGAAAVGAPAPHVAELARPAAPDQARLAARFPAAALPQAAIAAPPAASPPPLPPLAPSPPPPPPESPAVPTTPPFWWGTATAAYQVEGAATVGGRGPSIWDAFSQEPNRTNKGDTGAVADNFYYNYPEDIRLMEALGIRHFRMSISWSRIFPNGTGEADADGLAFYSELIDALLAAGVQPYVTLYHWDLPLALQEEYGGFNSTNIVADFVNYATTMFATLGDRVTYWTTFNEPGTFCFQGYGGPGHAPGTNSSVAAWNCVYTVLLAHAASAKEFAALVPGGRLSINLNCDWAEPLTSNPRDVEAAQRKLEFMLGSFADPLYKGQWPDSVRARVPSLPTFTDEQAASILNSTGYFALNHYTSLYVKYERTGRDQNAAVEYSASPNGPAGLIGAHADSPWLYAVPWGFRKMLNWVNARYTPSEIVVTENGCDVPNEDNLPMPAALNDTFRVDFYRGYVENAILAATIDKVPLKGYFAWSLLDNFEWADGYSKRFGIVHVDYKTQKRYVKASARWLAEKFRTIGR